MSGSKRPTADLHRTCVNGQYSNHVNHSQGMTVNSHNPDKDGVVKHETVLIETGPQDVRVLRTKLKNLDDLSIADDVDFGTDPYNSTGQYAALPDDES